MTSIFDPPTGARTFNASDWLAAIDVQMQAPPSAPADDEPITADSPPYRAQPDDDAPPPTWDTQPATRRRVRNLPWAIVATCAAMIWTMLVVAAFDGPPVLVVAALAVMALELLIWLGLAWRFNRL